MLSLSVGVPVQREYDRTGVRREQGGQQCGVRDGPWLAQDSGAAGQAEQGDARQEAEEGEGGCDMELDEESPLGGQDSPYLDGLCLTGAEERKEGEKAHERFLPECGFLIQGYCRDLKVRDREMGYISNAGKRAVDFHRSWKIRVLSSSNPVGITALE
jgi:hypothetical protein